MTQSQNEYRKAFYRKAHQVFKTYSTNPAYSREWVLEQLWQAGCAEFGKELVEALEHEKVDAESTKEESDEAYNRGIEGCINLIRQHTEEV